MESRKVSRHRRPSPAPVRPAQQPRSLFSCFWSCSRPSAASNEAVIDPRPPPLQQLKAAIDSEQRDQMYAAMERVTDFEDLYQSKSRVFGNQSAINYAIAQKKFIPFRLLLDRIINFLPEPEYRPFMSQLLIRAVKSGDLHFVRFLIENKGVPIELEQFLFHLAITHLSPRELLGYLYYKIDHAFLEYPYGKYSDTVWHTAVRFKNLDAFMFLFENKFRPATRNMVNSQGMSAAMMLVHVNRTAFLKQLLHRFPAFLTAWSDDYRNSLLHVAAITNAVGSLAMMLDMSPQFLDLGNGMRQSPLAQAVAFGSLEAAQLLLQRGANVFSVDSRGWDVLQICLTVGGRMIEIVPQILDALAQRQRDPYRLVSTVQYFLNEYQWKEAEFVLGKFPYLLTYHYTLTLHETSTFAATLMQFNCPILFEWALKKKIFPATTVLEAEGRTLLHMAAQIGTPFFISKLIEHGANINAFDRSSRTAFEIANHANNRAAMNAFMAQGNFVVDRNCRLTNFKAVLLNGGSFVTYRINRLKVGSVIEVLHLFNRLFTATQNVQKVDAHSLTVFAMQFELFLAYHLTRELLHDETILKKLESIIEVRNKLSERFSNLYLRDLLSSFTPAVRQKLEGIITSIPLASPDAAKIEQLTSEEHRDECFEQVFLDFSALYNSE